MKNTMVNRVFKIFLNTDLVILHDIEKDEYSPNELVYEQFINSSISEDIMSDIIEHRDSVYDKLMFKDLGITASDFMEKYTYAGEKHPKYSPEYFDSITLKHQKEVLDETHNYAKLKHNIEKEDLVEYSLSGLDIEDFISISSIKIKESYDAYGSGLYDVDGQDIVIFSTYDCGSVNEEETALTLCCYDKKTFKFELADIFHNIKNNEFYLSEIQTGYLPEELRKYDIKEFTGKRSFYWSNDTKILKLRCSSDIRVYLNEDKHDLYSQNVSGNRCEIQLT